MLLASPARRAGVVERGRLLRHQPRQLELDLGLGERVRDALVRADRRAPDDCARARTRRPCRAPARGAAVADRGAHDPLRVEPVEGAFSPPVSAPIRRSAGDLDVVEEQLPLLVRRAQRGRDVLRSSPGASVSTIKSSGRPRLPSASRARATTRIASRVLDAGDERLRARAARSRRSTRRAAVEMLCELEPASGSVIANATFVVPAAMPGSQRSFCSARAVPRRGCCRRSPARRRSGAASSPPPRSPRRPRPAPHMPSPPPPYSSGG